MEALRFWFRLGFISFGGPAGQIALMHEELVTRRRWLSEGRFMHALNYCMLLPGPEAQQLATYLGWLMHRTWGGVAAGMLFVLPSLFILIALSWVYVRFGQVGPVAAVFWGLKPAVTALVLQAAWRMGARTLHHHALRALATINTVSRTAAQIAAAVPRVVRRPPRDGSDRPIVVVDIGCGSGCVAIGIAARDPSVHVHAFDSSARAVECTQRNAALNGLANISVALEAAGNVPEPGSFDLALANPPYYADFRIAELFVDSAWRALAPGGTLLVVTKQPAWYVEHLPATWRDVAQEPVKTYHIMEAVRPE